MFVKVAVMLSQHIFHIILQKLIDESDEQWKNLFMEQIDNIVIAHDIFRLDYILHCSVLISEVS